MAIYYSPKTATQNLVLYLDAGNSQKSYPGSGTTWTDLSGRNNTASMIGSTPFSTDGGGCFDFATVTGSGGAPSANASLGFSFASNMVSTTGSYTFSAWIKNPPSTSAQVTLLSNTGGGDGYRWGPRLGSVYVLVGPDYTETGINYSSSLNSSLWYNIVTVFDRAGSNNGGTPQWQNFINGTLDGTASMPVSQTASTNGTPGIVRNPCCDLFTGKLAILSVYNKALTPTEIAQNFQALRGRFGV
jgi:hypothetical protein